MAAAGPAPVVELTPPASEPAPPCAPVLAKMLSSPPPALEELEEDDGEELPDVSGCPASPPAELAPSPGSPALGRPPPPTLGNPADALALAPPPGVGIPVDPAWPDCPAAPPAWVPAWEPCAACPPAEPDCPDDSLPGRPPAEDAPLGSDVDAEVPDDVDVCEALPGDWLGMPVLGRLPDPLEVDDEEDGDDEGDGEPEDGEPPEDGMPPDELLEEDDVAHPAVTSNRPNAATVAVRRRCAATTVVVRSMAIAPSGTQMSRYPEIRQAVSTSTARAGRV